MTLSMKIWKSKVMSSTDVFLKIAHFFPKTTEKTKTPKQKNPCSSTQKKCSKRQSGCYGRHIKF